MPSIIRVLDDETINKIAAGEVIENPASVVKELVENALDAGATDICIEIKGGGRQLIRISDNGCGMSYDDAVLCFERHATSKLRSIDNLHDTLTMGFRGEAIPSIASISKLTLLTCTHDSGAEGTMVLTEGGRMLKTCAAARSPGTTFEVKSLFFNVPVRKKFQKSPSYDTNEIAKIIGKIALANPSIKFELISNEQPLLSVKQPRHEEIKEQLAERVREVLGDDFLEGCCYIESSHDECHLHGYIGLPAYTRHNRTGQYLFIKRRPIFSPLVNNAIREGYGTTLPTNRHPVFVLHLDMPGDFVDVNVHPQKREVRLRQEQTLKRMICQTVDKGLQDAGIVLTSFFKEESFSSYVSDSPPETFAGYTFVSDPGFIEPERPFFKPEPIEIRSIKSESERPSPQLFDAIPKVPTPKILGTLSKFILVDASSVNQGATEGLCLIDQRAAHSRIIFEKLIAEDERASIEVEHLLVPYTLQLTPVEGATLLENIDMLNSLGIHIKEFGTNTFIIDAIPKIFGSIDIESFVYDLIKGLCEADSNDHYKQEKEKRIALAASRISISSKAKLSIEEAQELVKRLLLCKQPKICPSGKATMIHISSAELAKQFH